MSAGLPPPACEERAQQIAAHLARLFPGLDAQGLEEFGAGVEWTTLRGGEVLFGEGDAADAAYLVIRGRLRAVVAGADGERVLNEMGSGETVGEMALIDAAPRSATVYAVRDSHLARLSRETFDALTERHPVALRRIAGFVVERLRRHASGAPGFAPALSLALVPARPGDDASALARALAGELARFGRVVCVDRAAAERELGRGAADARDDEAAGIRLVHWLDGLDSGHRYCVHVADPEWTPWSERALRQADHVLVVAHAADGPALGPTEARLAETWRKRRPPRRSLLLLHADGESPRATAAWLAERDVEQHFHVRGGARGADVARLARLLTGNAVGLVLGGGGARGFAHLGVLRALEEAGVPVDAVGGTSIGSIIAAASALGFDAATAQERCRRSFSALFDPTFPAVALLTGRRIGARLEAELGGVDIEDLPIPYFCVSTNLSRAQEVVHRRGSLFLAVRSSISLPGILPPIALDGDLHVDGGLIDNLPIDSMRALCGEAVIAVDVSPEEDLHFDVDLARGYSGWRALWQRLSPFAAAPAGVPSMSSVLMRSVVVASLVKARERQAAAAASLYLKLPVAEWGLLEFQALGAIAARGYDASAPAVRAWWQERAGRAGGLSPGT